MTEREEFEKWYDDKTGRNGGVAYYVDIVGRYCFSDIETAWQAWQAARQQAVTIVMPPSPYMPDTEPGSMTAYEVGEAQGRCDMWAEVRRLNASATKACQPTFVPSGYALVPVEPTESILDTLYNHMNGDDGDGALVKAYKAMLAAAPQAGQAVEPKPSVCLVGMRGSAYDLPQTKRAYTYAEQPNNGNAHKLGEACGIAHAAPAGDWIDRGLALLKALQDKGFGVFALGAEYTAPPTPDVSGMVEALEPFAAVAGDYDEAEDGKHQVWKDGSDIRLTVRQFRAARDALAAHKQEGK